MSLSSYFFSSSVKKSAGLFPPRSKPYFGSLFALRCIVLGVCLSQPLQAALVNVSMDPVANPLQTPSGEIVPDGTSLFVVSFRSTENAFYTALRSASTASALVNVFSNELTFFNTNPVLKGNYDFDISRGWSSEGGAQVEVTTTNTANTPLYLLFSSSTNPFISTAFFLLLRNRSTS
jgi:hypothetical protein